MGGERSGYCPAKVPSRNHSMWGARSLTGTILLPVVTGSEGQHSKWWQMEVVASSLQSLWDNVFQSLNCKLVCGGLPLVG